jgi:hypothetical protein
LLDLERAWKWLERSPVAATMEDQIWLAREAIRALLTELEARDKEIEARLQALENRTEDTCAPHKTE